MIKKRKRLKKGEKITITVQVKDDIFNPILSNLDKASDLEMTKYIRAVLREEIASETVIKRIKEIE